MVTFDTLFFEQYIAQDESIEKVFHRHIFVMIEDLLIWIFFGLIIPAFLYYFNVFAVQTVLDSSYIHAYLFLIYFLLIYKIFDWYLDVWIATNDTLVDMRWKWFTPQLLYVPYAKIESIEIRTLSWLYSIISISDVTIHLVGDEHHTLSSALHPKQMVQFLQEKTKPEKKGDENDNKEPFEVLVDTLSGVVKNHLTNNPKEEITKDYLEKLDLTLTQGAPIDLRSEEDKTFLLKWRTKNISLQSDSKK